MAQTTKTNAAGLTLIQEQLLAIIRGRPDHVSVQSDDYQRVQDDVNRAATLKGYAVMRLTPTNGLTYLERGLFRNAIKPESSTAQPYVPTTAIQVMEKEKVAQGDTVKIESATDSKKACFVSLVRRPLETKLGGQASPSTDLAPIALYPRSPNNGPLDTLNALLGINENAIILLEDFQFFLTAQYPATNIRFREVLEALKRRTDICILVFTVGPTRAIPENMRSATICLDYPSPTTTELQMLVEAVVENAPDVGVEVKANKTTVLRLTESLTGLTSRAARTAFAQAVAKHKGISAEIIPTLMEERAKMFRAIAGEHAEFAPPPAKFDMSLHPDIVTWTNRQLSVLNSGDFRVPLSRGALLVGLPGTGKTTFAYWVSTTLGLPVIKVSMGDLGGSNSSKIGAISGAMRAIFDGAYAIRYCILLFDDVLKAVDSTENAKRGGGTSEFLRAVSTFLMATEDPKRGQTRILLMATGNTGDFTDSFPEGLLERFPDKFLVGKPDASQRADIFRIEIGKHDLDPSQFDLKQLADETDGLVGRNIRDVVDASIAVAFEQRQELNTDHILARIRYQDSNTVMIGGHAFKNLAPSASEATRYEVTLPSFAEEEI